MNTVLMQGYKIELTYHDSQMDFLSTAGSEHGMTEAEWKATLQSLKGHYFWYAQITSHGGLRHLTIQSMDIGPTDCPGTCMMKFMQAVSQVFKDVAPLDAKELVPDPATA